MTVRRLALHFAGAAAIAFSPAAALAQPAPKPPVKVAGWKDQQVTGVAVSKDGRIFVNLPRWTLDVPISVAEVAPDGRLKPYPDGEWNSWRNAAPLAPGMHFVCVQSVVFDAQGYLWVVDPGAPASEKVIPGAAKLVKIDIRTDTVVQVIPFDESVAPRDSYLNDIRFSPDGRYGYLTDSGKGALVVLELATGKAWRVLDGDPSTQAEKGVTVKIDGAPLRRPDGRTPQFNADGIAVSADGRYVYYKPLTGIGLYRVPTAVLNASEANPQSVGAAVETLPPAGIADGLWIDEQDRLYVTAPEENALKVRYSDGHYETLLRDPRLRWPDSLAEGADGTIYVTTSHLQDSPWFKPGATTTPSEIWKVKP